MSTQRIREFRYALAIAGPFLGYAAFANTALEEITVTAQKREQTLEDVPLSVSAISGEAISHNGIAQIEDLTIMVPNFNIGDAPGEHTVNIRGIGSATSNRAFEQSVGLYVDGIYTGRPQQFLAPLMDVERVEVVRGPQGVLFGKNSNAGAVSVVTARPGADFRASLGARYESEYGGHLVEGMLNVPITDQLSARFAAVNAEQAPYMDNTAGSDGPTKDLQAIRASVLWSPADNLQIYAKLETAEVEWRGTNFQVLAFGDGPARGFYTSQDPDAEDDFDLNQQQDGNFIGNGDIVNGPDADTYVLQADWTLANTTLTYTGGHSGYTSRLGFDADFSGFPGLYSEGGDDFDQTSHEIRLTSASSDTFDYMAGVFWMDRNYRIPLWQFHANFAQLPPPLPPFTRVRNYDENTETASAFIQGTYRFNEAWSVALGLRYVDEQKSATSQQYTSVMGDPATPIPGGIPVFPNYSFAGDRDENSLTPSLNVQWEPNDRWMFYVSYNEAEKSGGFNSNSGVPIGIEYETESAAGYEFGAKILSGDGRMRLNTAIFRAEFDDYQVSSYDGVVQSVNNAATTVTQGVEIEFDWAAAENLTVGGALAYLDAYYSDFRNAPCAPVNQSDCVGGNFRDATDERITFAPRYSGSLYGIYEQPVGSSHAFRLRLTGNFSDDYDTQIDKSPETVAESFFVLNARAAFGDRDRDWEVAIVGQNLTDERLFNFAGNMPFFPGAIWANTKPPRLVYLEAVLNFN